MFDRENVINDLNVAKIILCNTQILTPEMCLRIGRAITSAIDLLKEQEPAEAIEITNDFYPIGDPLRTIGWKCGQCGTRIACYDNYCPDCGKAVKWDG